MRDLIVAVVVFGLLPKTMSQPQVGIYLWSWIGYHNPHRLSFGWSRDFPWAMLIALATFIGVMRSKDPKIIPWTRETKLMLFFVFWMALTTATAFYPELAFDNYKKVFKVLLMTYVTLLVINTKERLDGLIIVICLSLGFYGLKGGLFTILHGGTHRVQGPDGTFFGGNNEMALVLAMTIPFLSYWRSMEKRNWLRMGLSSTMMLSAIACIGSQSRGGMLGLAAMGFFLWLKSNSKFMTGIMIASSVLIIGSLMPQQWYDRMNTIKTYDKDDSSLGRINAWWTAFNVAKVRITGGGMDMFQYATFRQYAPEPDRVHDVHSIYFEQMGEQGFIGFGIFLSLGFMTWARCAQIKRFSRNKPALKWASDLAGMLQVSLVGYATAGAFLGLSYFDLYYHIIAMSVMIWTFIQKQPDVVAPDKPAPRGKRTLTRRART